MSCKYTFNGRVLNLEQLFNEIMSELLAHSNDDTYAGIMSTLFKEDSIEDTCTILEKHFKDSKEHTLRNGYIGLSTYMDRPLNLGKTDSHGLPQMQQLYPLYNEENLTEELYKRIVSDSVNIENTDEAHKLEITDEIKSQLEFECLNKYIGDGFHAVVGALLATNNDESSAAFMDAKAEVFIKLKEKDSKNRTALDFASGDLENRGFSKLTEELAYNIILDRARLAARIIRSLHSSEAKYYSEVDISSEDAIPPINPDTKLPEKYTGIHGRADLIIVDKDEHGKTKVTILDFKVANRKFNDWCAAKKYHTEYQLGFYRHMLVKAGIDPASIELEVYPVYFPKTLGSLEQMEVATRPINLEQNNDRLVWGYGKFWQNINKMLPVPVLIRHTQTDDMFAEVAESLQDLVTYTPESRSYTVEDFMNNFIHIEKVNDKIQYTFINPLEKDGKKHVYTSKEEITKPDGVFEQFQAQAKAAKNRELSIIQKEIKQCREDGRVDPENGFLNSNKRKNDADKILAATFGIFTLEQYIPVDIPLLADFGILAYENTDTHALHFVCLTDQGLRSKVDNHGQTTVLGNFYENDEVRHILGMNALDATCGNMELIKTMHVINLLYDKFPQVFAGKSIASIEVVNAAFGLRQAADIQQLKDNFGLLCSSAKMTNHFASDIPTLDLWRAMVFDLNRFTTLVEQDDILKGIYTKLSLTEASRSKRLRAIEECISKMKRYYKDLRTKNLKDIRTFNLSNPVHMTYLTLCAAYNEMLNIPINYSGEISKYGLHFGEVIRILTLPFIKNQSNTDKHGNALTGLGSGTELTSPQTVPSITLQALYKYYDMAFLQVRDEYAQARANINKITAPYILKRTSQLHRALIGQDYDIWEELLVKGEDGKTPADRLILQNPDDPKCTLDPELKEFLRAILWEINKYRLFKPNDDLVKLSYANADDIPIIENEMKENSVLLTAQEGRYYELPLRRSSDFQRLKNIGRLGIVDYFTKGLKRANDDFDPRQLHTSRADQLKVRDKNSLEMYNAYDISSSERDELIQKEGIWDFEFDLDYLTSDVAFQSIRQHYFERVLIAADTVATAMHLLQQTTDQSFRAELDAADDQTKVFKGESLIDPDLSEASTAISALKRLNSVLVIGCRPLQFIKELTFGQMTNYSRAFGLTASSNKVSATNVFKANLVIWGQSGKKYGNAFTGEGDIADYTMCEALNKEYGFANEDLNRLVENSTQARIGFLSNTSRFMYISNSAPDYFNRMTLFIAKMMEDGCFEAHTLKEDGTLKYDFTKDARFSELKLDERGFIIKPTSKEGMQQLALYRAMAKDFESEGYTLIGVDEHGKELLKALPKAYTTNQRDSIKEVSDLAYGFYDHEAKSLMDHKFVGLVFKQFMTFWTAKVQLWFRGKPVTQGDNTSQGQYKQATVTYKNEETGEMVTENLYRRIKELPDGRFEQWDVPESALTEEEKAMLERGELEPVLKWQGDYSEGLIYSILGAMYDLIHLDFKGFWNNKYQRANCRLAAHDLIVGVLLYYLLRWLWSAGTNKMQDVAPTHRILLRAMNDVSPLAIGQLSWEPGFYTALMNIKTDMSNLLFADQDFDVKRTVYKRVGAVKDMFSNEDFE